MTKQQLTEWEPGTFYIDSFPVDGPLFNFAGYTFNRRWNGWECPVFSFEVATRIMNEYNTDGVNKAWYNEETDTFTFFDGNAYETIEEAEKDSALDICKGFEITVQARTVKVYGVGDGWVWSRKEAPEKLKKEHVEALNKLDNVIQELSQLCEEDERFNDLISGLNDSQQVFTRSLDEYNVQGYISDLETQAGKEWEDGRFIFHGTHIENPFYSECLRFPVDPLTHYGLSKEELKILIDAMD